VASEHPAAAAAGAEMLRAGGTAADAAIAAAAAVCVVHASSCGLGGGGFALVHRADGRDFALDYREVAPAGATPEHFRTGGKPEPALLRTGGSPSACQARWRAWWRSTAASAACRSRACFAPAVRLARDGFTLAEAPHLAREIEHGQSLLAADPELRSRFLAGGASAPGPDYRIVQADLARTLEAVAAHGARAFYRGPRAAAIAAAVRARGGVLGEADLARYRPRWRRPLASTFRGRRIVTFPRPARAACCSRCSGSSRATTSRPRPGHATALHLLAGVMAQGFADRARWYGDPEFTRVPVAALLAAPRLAALRRALSALRPTPQNTALVLDHGTAHVSVADAEGNAAAITTTINTGFGAGILVAGTGVILNNEMDDFALAPGVPNVYGLVGTAATRSRRASARSRACRRPSCSTAGVPSWWWAARAARRSSPGPCRWCSASSPSGSAGEAVEAPRVHDQAAPPVLAVEAGVEPSTRGVLERLGHHVVVTPGDRRRLRRAASPATGRPSPPATRARTAVPPSFHSAPPRAKCCRRTHKAERSVTTARPSAPHGAQKSPMRPLPPWVRARTEVGDRRAASRVSRPPGRSGDSARRAKSRAARSIFLSLPAGAGENAAALPVVRAGTVSAPGPTAGGHTDDVSHRRLRIPGGSPPPAPLPRAQHREPDRAELPVPDPEARAARGAVARRERSSSAWTSG